MPTGTMTLAAARPGSLEHWAQARPDSAAIIEGDRSLSWGQWNDAADRLADALAEFGVVAGDIIAVRTQIRTEWAIIHAAISKLGGSILGLNWRLTPAEVRYVTDNSCAVGLICDDAAPAPVLAALSDLKLKIAISIDTPVDGFALLADLLAQPAPRRVSTQEAGLVIYTSGTTGLPKGVVRRPPTPEQAKRLAEYTADMQQRQAIAGDAVVFCTMPFSHGAGPVSVRTAMAAGNRMIFQRRFDPEQALQLIQQHGVTHWTAVPTMLKRIAGLPEDRLARYDVGSIQCIQTGAAPVPYSLKLWVLDYFGADVLHEAYGATEVGMISHLTPQMQTRKPGSSGLPYRHVEISVRDDRGRELPANKAGEFWVRSPLTIDGYLNAPPLDDATLDDEGFFRVGDVGYLDDEGYVYITDRAKDMIISGGVNIYPAEIEAALIQHPAVQDVAVIGIPDDEFGEQVKAFVEVKPERSLLPDDLIAFSATLLASYKRPKSVEIVAELPRNMMGKVLKKDLRAPYWAGRERAV